MNIHFIAMGHEFSLVHADKGRLDVSDETFDPMECITNFHSFFDRLDGLGRVEKLRIDTQNMRAAFWDRHEFLAMLREVCVEDVYIQSSDYYTLFVGFLSQQDRDSVEARMAIPRHHYSRTFDRDLEYVINDWLVREMDVRRSDYVWEANDKNVTFHLRDETVSGLMEMKFSFTKKDDHLKPAVAL